MGLCCVEAEFDPERWRLYRRGDGGHAAKLRLLYQVRSRAFTCTRGYVNKCSGTYAFILVTTFLYDNGAIGRWDFVLKHNIIIIVMYCNVRHNSTVGCCNVLQGRGEWVHWDWSFERALRAGQKHRIRRYVTDVISRPLGGYVTKLHTEFNFCIFALIYYLHD